MADPAPPVRRPRVADHRTHWAIVAVSAGLVVVAALAGFFFVRSARLEEARSLAENDAIAHGIAAFIEAREQAYVNVLLSYAGRFRFREAIERRDRAEALVHLRQLHETFPELDRAFLADPAGVVWAVYPDVPGVVGRSSAHRDWYQGVSREGRPYMGEVVRGSSPGQPLAVALVAPVRDLHGRVIGIIGSGQRLDVIRGWLLPITVPDGDLYIVNRKGQFVFHRVRTGADQLADYARVPVVQRLLRGEEGVAELENPVEGEVGLSAYRRLPSLGWGVVVQRSRNLALQGTRRLMLVSAATGLLLVGALAVLAGVAFRNHRETAAALAALEERTRQLQEAQEELVRKERLAILGQLAGGVSHELRNPLGVIKNSVYYLRMVLPEDDRVNKHLGILEREIGTANRIVSDLLDFARMRAPSRMPTDLNAVVRDVLERMPVAPRIRVALDLTADLPPVSVDPEQVGQVLGNLVTNAVQAMPDGGTLTLATARADGGVALTVADTGVGIAPEQVEKVSLVPHGHTPQARGPCLLYRGKGCRACNFTGIKGRVALYEVMPVTEEIRGLISSQAPTSQIREAARRHGMRTLREAGFTKLMEGLVTLEETVRVTAE